jgi:outer membrane receptor for ferrienterochelin and colicin
METKTTPEDPGTDWKGSSGPGNLSGVQNFQYEYRTFTTFGYNLGSWNMNLRYGIDNVFDKQPERTFADNLTTAYGSTNAGFYDILGRRYYVGMNFGF